MRYIGKVGLIFFAMMAFATFYFKPDSLILSRQAPDRHLVEIEEERINKLFDLLHQKESVFKEALQKLNVFSFENFTLDDQPCQEKNLLFKLNGHVRISYQFVDKLKEMSNYYLTASSRHNITRNSITKIRDKPVIVTAADRKYFHVLSAAVSFIHQNYPDYEFIIYDLGLTNEQLQMVTSQCKCIVKQFDPSGYFRSKYPHISRLKTYAWKPIIVQESLEIYDTVMYMDSSIRLLSSEIRPIVDVLGETKFLAQFIPLGIGCYTNPKMFDWFHLDAKKYEEVFSIDANFLLFKKSILTSLIMKAWVTCALDESCIAPEGSRLSPCCGCHRYDQDALTIVTSYFYSHPFHPNKTEVMPPVSFSKEEAFFFKLRRGHGMDYFRPEPSCNNTMNVI